jgi:hypothetical protein
MAEDIVEWLRKELASPRFTPYDRVRLIEAVDEIERLRGGGWTRLGPESLPPSDGTPFELRFDGLGHRFCVSQCRQTASILAVYADGGCLGWTHQDAPDWASGFKHGWWRLLPGGEPPR